MQDKGIELLRYAIVIQAIEDYDKSLRFLRKIKKPDRTTEYLRAERIKKDCETFFLSHWFSELCDLDGKMIMESIRRKSYNRKMRLDNG